MRKVEYRIIERVWFVYLLTNPQHLLYTGITTEPARRLREHNGSSKGARYTRGKGPWTIAYLEPVADRVAALKREYAIKQFSRARKLALIAAGSDASSHLALAER